MLSGGNQTDGNSLERLLTPYQNSRLPLKLKVKENEECPHVAFIMHDFYFSTLHCTLVIKLQFSCFIC